MTHSLNGLRILNTRPRTQAKKLTHSIIAAGGMVIECPTLEIQALSDEWVHYLPDLSTVDHAVFISPNAVHYCFKQLQAHSVMWPNTINVIAIGQATANALKEHHVLCSGIPDIPNSEHLLSLASLQHPDQQKVLLFKGLGGRQLIEDHLTERGAIVLPQLVYQRAMPEIDHQFVDSIWRNDEVDIILLTSEQSIQNLFIIFGKEAFPWLQSKTCLVISERLAQSASLFGINKIIKSHPERMINTLFDYSQGLFHGQ